MTEEIDREVRIKSLLEQAMRDREFTLVFQTKVDAASSEPFGMEALCRWRSPVLGQVSPSDFLPILSKTSLMDEFCEMIFHLTLDVFNSMRSSIPDRLSLSVNVSPVFFLKDTFETFVMNALRERDIPPERIILEITEEAMIAELSSINLKAGNLRSHGIRISLDDFGSGYSSLKYLTAIHFDEIKIDKAFIDPIAVDEQAYALLTSIMAIAKVMDCQVVAEGVETQTQAERILQAGCRVHQGYLYSRPVPAEEMTSLLSEATPRQKPGKE